MNIFPIGSGAREPSQLIGKNEKGGLLEPRNALVYFVYTPAETFFGGGAFLNKKYVLAPFIIFSKFYTKTEWRLVHFRVAIGLREINQVIPEVNFL